MEERRLSLARPSVEAVLRRQASQKLLDLGPRRLAEMDEAGLDAAVLSLTTPGIGSSSAWLETMSSLTRKFASDSAALADAQRGAYLSVYQTLQEQASVLSYIDLLSSLALFCACMATLAMLLQKPPKGLKQATH